MAGPTAALLASIVFGLFVYDVLESSESWSTGVRYVLVALIVFCLVWFGIRYMKWVSTNFVVTTDRVIHRVGVIAKQGIEIPLERINTVFFHQSIFERMLGAGDLGIESAGERGEQTFEAVRQPAIVQNGIYRQLEANAKRLYGGRRGHPEDAVATQPTGEGSIPAQLDQLDDLRKRSVITEQEFAAKKADLLNRM